MHFPEMYLSGGFNLSPAQELDMLKRTKYKHRCISAAFVIPENLHYSKREAQKMELNEKKHTKIMLDSGAASLHTLLLATSRRGHVDMARQALSVEALQKEMYERYISFVKEKLKHKKIWFYVTLDFKKHQPTIFKMQKKFIKDGLCPAPVFHGDAGVEWLKKYADLGITYMCLGSIQTRKIQSRLRKYFDIVFNEGEKLGLQFHGLGFSSPALFLDYPFKSMDTAAWTKVAAYGSVVVPSESCALKPIHISSERTSSLSHTFNKMPAVFKKKLVDYIHKYGFDFKLARTSAAERGMWNAYVYSHLGKMDAFFESSTTGEGGSKWENLL